MSDWPLEIPLEQGSLYMPRPGKYALLVSEYDEDLEVVTDQVLAAAYHVLGNDAVGWLPEDGGLLGNLPAWENILLSTQWHAPAALPALEKRVHGWCGHLGYDTTALAVLFSRQPSFLSDDDRRMMGWLRQLLARPQIVVLRAGALPSGRSGAALQALIDEEMGGAALLVVDEQAPPGFEILKPGQHGASSP